VGGLYAAVDAEAAFAEVATAVVDHVADTTDAHDASAISVVDAADYYAGTDVEAVLQELGAAVAAVGSPTSIWVPVLTSNPSIVTTTGEAVWVPWTTLDGDAVMVEVPV